MVCKIGVVSDYYNLIHRHNINNYFLCKVESFGEKELTEDERNNIENIIAKGEEIELWDRELERITKDESDKILEVDSFEIKGNLHDFVELENEVKDINYRKTALKNIMEIEEWCKEQFEGKPEYSRRLPRQGIEGISVAKEGEEETEEQRELHLGRALRRFKQSTIWKNYQEGKEKGLSREEIKQEYGMREGEIALVERYESAIEEYNYGDLNIQADNIIKIEKWCKEQFEGKPEYSRRTPRSSIKGIKTAKEERELGLGQALNKFKQSTIWKNYQEGKEKGLSREEIKQEYGMREGEIALVERYERIIEEYGVKKKTTGQSIGQVSYTATVQKCDEAQKDLNKLIHEQQEITQKD